MRPITIALSLLVASAPAHAAPGGYPSEFTTEEEATGIHPGDPPFKPVPPRLHEQRGPQRIPLVRRIIDHVGEVPRVLSGGLSGKSVYLSPGHGWTYTSTGGWATQRPNTHGVVEDFGNADGIGQFLVPYLLAAGAQVVGVKELDPTAQMVILDNSDGTKNPSRGRYTESGPGFSNSTLKGWGHPPLPMTGTTNPFTRGGNRLMAGSKQETARATFVPNVPADGHYNLYISYSMYSGRASDARVTVVHPGGKTSFMVDQRRHGGTWVLIGRFYFDRGTSDQRGAVIVTNQTDDAGANVSVDAVRLGGGLGLMDRGGGTSKQSRADECSRYHAQFSGAPGTVYDWSTGNDRSDDISARSRFAAWVHAQGEPAVYISHHTNAATGSARGTESYIYGKNPVDGKYQPTPETLALGSDKLCQAVHDEIIADVQAGWDASWYDRKIRSAYFGELNTSNNNEMASMLLETAFHDNVQDADALKSAAFRRLVARAIYKGVVKYFAAKDGNQPRLLPEPPTALVARNSGTGQVTVSWQAPASGGALGDPATSYRVFSSAGGHAFDNGADTGSKTSWTLKNLKQGQVVYLRVRAVNAGGWSLPSPTLAVGVSAGGTAAPVLLVTGSDRLDATMNLKLSYPNLAAADRIWPDQINNGTYLVQHGRALAPSHVPFDAATHDAVDKGKVSPDKYRMVLWQAGRGLKGNRALNDAGRTALEQAAASGTSLVMSGSVLARWLGGSSASSQDKAFLSGELHAKFESASQAQSSVAPAAKGLFEGLKSWSLSTSYKSGPYEVKIPDVIAPAGGGASLAASYTPGGGGAVVQHKGSGRCSVLMGFPLETVLPPQRQAEIVGSIFKLCDVKAPPAPDGGWPSDGGVGDGPPVAGDGVADPGEDGCGCRVAAPGRRGFAALLLLGVLALLALPLRRRRNGPSERT